MVRVPCIKPPTRRFGCEPQGCWTLPLAKVLYFANRGKPMWVVSLTTQWRCLFLLFCHHLSFGAENVCQITASRVGNRPSRNQDHCPVVILHVGPTIFFHRDFQSALTQNKKEEGCLIILLLLYGLLGLNHQGISMEISVFLLNCGQ